MGPSCQGPQRDSARCIQRLSINPRQVSICQFNLKGYRAVAADIDNFLPKPYAGEMRGIAKALNMNLGGIVGMNILYDVTAFCTSIVSQDANGQIWHSRNLDYSFVDMLRNITIRVDFIKKEPDCVQWCDICWLRGAHHRNEAQGLHYDSG